MNTPHDDLHKLIHSLSRIEKRNFKVQAQTNTIGRRGDGYIRLFDVIARQLIYNEEDIKQHFRNSYISKNFAYNKHYLFEQLINCLIDYKNKDISFESQLQQFHILIEKGIYNKAAKVLQKLKSNLLNIEEFEKLINVYQQEIKHANILGVDMHPLIKHTEEITAKLLNLNQYRLLQHDLYKFMHKNYSPRNKKQVEQLTRLVKEPLLVKETRALSERSKIIFHYVHLAYSHLAKNIEKAAFHSDKVIRQMIPNPWYINNSPIEFVNNLKNHVVIVSDLKRWDEANTTIDRIRLHIDSNKFTTAVRLACQTRYLYSRVYGYHAQLNKAELEKSLVETEKFLAENDSLITHDFLYFNLRFYICSFLFEIGEYKRALYQCNHLVNNNYSTPAADENQALAAIVRLIIYYEQGKYDLLPYVVFSTYRHLLKKGQLYKTEKVILRFLNRDIADVAPSARSEVHALFRKLRAELYELSKEPTEKPFYEYIALLNWLDSKLGNTSLWEVKLRNKK